MLLIDERLFDNLRVKLRRSTTEQMLRLNVDGVRVRVDGGGVVVRLPRVAESGDSGSVPGGSVSALRPIASIECCGPCHSSQGIALRRRPGRDVVNPRRGDTGHTSRS